MLWPAEHVDDVDMFRDLRQTWLELRSNAKKLRTPDQLPYDLMPAAISVTAGLTGYTVKWSRKYMPIL